MQTAIEEYGRHLRMPPQEAFEAMSIIAIEDSDPKAWSVTLDLWTIEEGRSDVSVEMTVVDDGETTRVELDNIHVL